jgi:hypothetical protein
MRAWQDTGVEVSGLLSTLAGSDEIFQPLGYNLTEATALLASFEAAGISGDTVTAGLGKVISNMAKKDIPEFAKGLRALFVDLQKSGDAEAAKKGLMAFGKAAGLDLADALKEGKFNINDFYKKLKEGNATAIDVEKSTRTTSENLIVLQHQVEESLAGIGTEIKNAIGEDVLNTIQSLVESLDGLVKQFAALPPDTKKTIVELTLFAAALGPIAIYSAAVVKAIGELISILGGLVVWVLRLKVVQTIFGSLFTWIGTTAPLMIENFGWALASWITPVEAFFASIGTAIGGAIQWLGALPGMSAALTLFSGVLAGLAGAALIVGGDLQLFFKGVGEAISFIGSKIGEVLSTIWTAVSTSISSVIVSIQETVAGWVDWMGTELNRLIGLFDAFLQSWGINFAAAWDYVVNAVSEKWQTFVNWISESLDFFAKRWAGFQENMRKGIFVLGDKLNAPSLQQFAIDSQKAANAVAAGQQEIQKEVAKTAVEIQKLSPIAVTGGAEIVKSTAKAKKGLEETGAAAGGADVDLSALWGNSKKGADEATKAIDNFKKAIADAKLDQVADKLKDAISEGAKKSGSKADFSGSFDQLADITAQKYEEGILAGVKNATPEQIAEAKKLAQERAQIDNQVYKESIIKEQLEADKTKHKASVDFWQGLMEDAISGTRFDFVEQFKKAAVEIAAEWLTRLLEANAFGADSFGGFFDIASSTLGDALGSWAKPLAESFGLGDLFGGASAIGPVADGAQYGASLEAAAAATEASTAATNALTAALPYAGWAAVGLTAAAVGYNNYQKFSGWGEATTDTQKGANVATAYVDVVFPGIGTAIDTALSYFGVSFGSALTKNQQAIRGFEGWVEDALKKAFGKTFDFVVTDINQFDDGSWADTFWTEFGDRGGDTFSALGTAFEKLLGLEPGVGGQLGALLAQNLAGVDGLESLDNIKLFMDSIGVSTADLTESLLQMALAGEMTWHEFESMRQALEKIPTEGLAAFGDMAGAFDQVLQSGGAGKDALIGLKNIAVEAGEAGVTSFAQLRDYLLAAGYAAAEVDAMIQAFGQRGITSFEELQNASDPALGGVIADMQTLGVVWEKFATSSEALEGNVKNLADAIKELSKAIKDIPEHVSTEIEVNKTGSGANEKVGNFAKGGVIWGPHTFRAAKGIGLMGESGPEAIMPLTRVGGKLGVSAEGMGGMGSAVVINIDATGAQAGVEHRILAAMQTIRKETINDAAEAMARSGRRGVY